MARLDAYIDLLFKEPGSELVMETGTGALLRTGSVYRSPTFDQNQEEVRTTPHAARPRPQRRARLVTSAN